MPLLIATIGVVVVNVAVQPDEEDILHHSKVNSSTWRYTFRVNRSLFSCGCSIKFASSYWLFVVHQLLREYCYVELIEKNTSKRMIRIPFFYRPSTSFLNFSFSRFFYVILMLLYAYSYAIIKKNTCPCMNDFYLTCMWMHHSVYYIFVHAHIRKWKKKCTKKEARVATMHGHVCLCSSLFLIKNSNIHILCYKKNFFNIRLFTYIRNRIKTEGYMLMMI